MMRILPLFLLIIVCSCSNHLQPVSYTNASQRNENSNCGVQFTWMANEGDLMIFDLQVKNTSDEILFIDPEQFYYKTSFDHPAKYTITPTDPYALTEYDVSHRLKAKIRSKGMFKVLVGMVSAGLNAYSGLSIGEGLLPGLLSNQQLMTATTVFAGEVATSALDHKQEMLEEDLEYVPDEIAKKTSIRPGHSFQGKVFFDAIPKMQYYEFILPIEGNNFVYTFTK
jgi:hypothetical protein